MKKYLVLIFNIMLVNAAGRQIQPRNTYNLRQATLQQRDRIQNRLQFKNRDLEPEPRNLDLRDQSCSEKVGTIFTGVVIGGTVASTYLYVLKLIFIDGLSYIKDNVN